MGHKFIIYNTLIYEHIERFDNNFGTYIECELSYVRCHITRNEYGIHCTEYI